jgi:hypothetical protein
MDEDVQHHDDRSATAASSSSNTSVIPVHCDENDDDEGDLPQWTLIEVNGELLPPKEMPAAASPTSSATASSLECELGCIWFDQDDTGKIVRFLL